MSPIAPRRKLIKIKQNISESTRCIREESFPSPPLATQQAIVAEIEAEQALVGANRELIVRMEKKVQATLARVWGEDDERETEPEREL